MNKYLFVALILLITACSKRSDRIENITSGEPIQAAVLAKQMEQYKVPGVSIAVINNGDIAWAQGYGMADVELQGPVTTETRFQAASISKPVAAMAALRLVEQGLLDLDADVNVKLMSWQVPANDFTTINKITLRRLLNHTAGTTVWGFPGYASGATVPATVAVLKGEGNTDPITVYKEPGESWQYSGGGYTIVQLLLSDIVGKSFPEIMAEMVLQPVGMNSSTYEQPLPEQWHVYAASGYRGDGTKVTGNWHTYPEMAAAGLWTTPSDLARFAIQIQRAYAGEVETFLTQAMVRQMLTPGMNNHGLGPGISEDGLRFGHGGANEGFRCEFMAFTEGGNGVVVMTNSDNGGKLAHEIILSIAEGYGWPGFAHKSK
jgi:CubicO group peptidase (beta-lactamase class C family)